MPFHELDYGEVGSWVYLQGKDPLMLQLAFRNNVEGLEEAFQDEYHKQWLDGYNARGCSPLRLAATSGHTEACRWLVDHGADINITDCRWQTPLAVAIKHNKPETAEFLLSRGAAVDGDPMSACTPLYGATFECNLRSLKILVKYRALLDRSCIIPGKYTITPLYQSLTNSKKKIFRYLLLSGADPDYTCTKLRLMYKHIRGSQSLYHTCVEKNVHEDFAILLYNMGAGLYYKDYKGRYCTDERIKDRYGRHDTGTNQCRAFLQSVFYKPRTLQSVCRITIRRAMGRWTVQERCDKLPLPTDLKLYLKHADTEEPDLPPSEEVEDKDWYRY